MRFLARFNCAFSRTPLKFVSQNESGVALLEFGIVLPLFLIFLVVGTVDVGHMVNYHHTLNQVSREGVQLLTSLGDLEPGCFISQRDTSTNGFSTSSCSAGTFPRHQLGHLRMHQLAFLANMRLQNNVEVETRFECVNSATGVASADIPPNCTGTQLPMVTARVRVDYNPFFVPLFPIPLEVQRQGAFLFRNAPSAAPGGP